ncbi:MAG: OmpA family protein, partial [Solirubrobacterales bacterium]|nr:OmpA family protein [Solirubrobacterales bacterium]
AVGPIQVTGYTDSIGTDQVNIPLSNARAQSVITALTPLTPGVSYQAAGKGSADPVAPNTLPNGSDNPAGRRLNRRVTIAFQAKAPARPAAPPATTSAPAAAGTSQTINYEALQGDGSIHNYTVRPDLAYRDGNLLVVRATVTCMGATNLPASASTSTNPNCDGNDFAGSETVPPETPHQFNLLSWVNSYTVRTLYLADPATGSEYIPASLPDDQPLTAALPQLTWSQGQSYAVWAYFPAPPATSTKVTVLLAGGGSTQIPIAPSPPAVASSGG